MLLAESGGMEERMEHQVTLTEMLDARERRAYRQQELLEKYSGTLLCFTMNIAGPVKNSALIRRGFETGKRVLAERLGAAHIRPIYFEEVNGVTGNEAFYVFEQDAFAIKEITSDIEDESDLGRLFDMDVLTKTGRKIDRTEMGRASRRCFICGKPAKECSRSRVHSVSELQEKTKQILIREVEEVDSKDVARLACRALLYEVCTTPKPGLVDRANSGSHRDMDIFTFMDSAAALHDYFERCVRIGRQTEALLAADTFSLLRQEGKRAEARMFAATRGVNTHKGAIFSMGILSAALGRLPRGQWEDADRVLGECAAMVKGIVAADFQGITKENAVTVGQKLYLDYGITGVRGQAEAGFPAVRETGLPVLREGMKCGLSINDAGCAALLALMTAATDTNLIARSNREVQQETVEYVREVLTETPYPSKEVLEKMDGAFMEKNLSPGGSADLLAICYLLYFLENDSENFEIF